MINMELTKGALIMFCNQCEQTVQGKGCTKVGVCGKQPDVSALQDLLTYAIRGLAHYNAAARANGGADVTVGRFIAKSLFSTLTNVNFDADFFAAQICEAVTLRKALAQKNGAVATNDPAASFEPATDLAGLTKQGEEVGLPIGNDDDEDIKSTKEITLYGLRGVAAYADHAAILGQEDDAVYAYVDKALTSLTNDDLGLNDWVGLALECGTINIRAMELLDAGNTGTFGHPEPAEVALGGKAGKAILITGHDLKDLKDLLEQTEGKGVNVYTHGEMLPAHGYPELRKYPHLAGHYGTAWQNQKKEFKAFPGAVLFTTNCLMPPEDSYAANIFTTGLVGFAGIKHVANGDFGPVIDRALALDGFAADEITGKTMTGFARNAVLGVADKVIAGVKAGAIKHFFLVGGCDGAKPGRNYYTEFVEKTPSDTVVLTLACGKFRFFDKDLGDIGGIPRLLDVGQCNDAYSAVQIAVALADAFECGVNDLPLSFILSWYEQKAVAILLSLFSLGIKGIKLGPTLPAFVSPNVLNVLVENFAIAPISTVDEDLAAILS
jgi:hydroxylamine reductase